MVFWCDCLQRNGYQQISATAGGGQGPRFGVRHVQCLLVFCGLAVAYALRVNLSVAIVAMTDRNATNPNFEEFDWDESVKSYLLSSFFWGYVITQVPGGYLSHKYGAKFTFFFGVLICSVLALLTPLFAEIGDWPLLLILRAVQGLCQGMIFPSTHTFLSKWAPAEERGRLVSYCYSGAQFGTVIMLSISGFIASSWMGWPSIFYVSGLAGLVWAIFWFLYCASTPAEHPTITANERRFIETSGPGRRPSDAGRVEASEMKTPWLKIFTSMPFLTLLVVHCANNWGFWTLLTEIPTYMKNILGMDIRSNGPLSALPYLAMTLLSYGFIFVADIINHNSVMPLFFSRKLFNTLGMWIPMMALIGLGYITTGESTKLAIALLTIAVGANAATYLGFQVNHIDLSPNFAGTLMGITNCAANIMSIIAPLTVGLIVTDETNPLQWRIVFYITAGFYFFGNLLFLIFGRTSPREWNMPTSRNPSSTSSSPVHAANVEDASQASETDRLQPNST
ncbi:putative inorganic phosphate cotransporter [Calliphora vicina]|uniref:putative inorganic phosphate cotransporter n=1 Tax=Calliphora vicina TaxID=7373 RepID=UPI00325B6AFD